ncbi:MAG: zinc-dependent metalloprotease, partial [Acidimicrobiales bacterium]
GPFGGFGFDPSAFGRMFAESGPISWELARWMVSQDAGAQANVDPLRRIRLDELLRVAELQVGDVTGLATAPGDRPLSVKAVSPAGWADASIEDYKALLERLAQALSPPAGADLPTVDLPPGAEALGPLFAQLPKILGPMMMGMQTGMLLSQLSSRAFGPYELPIPRPGRQGLLLVPQAIDAFAASWSLPQDDVSLWVCVHEVTHHAVLSVPHVQRAVTDLLMQHAGGFRPDGVDIESRLGGIDPNDPEALQSLLGDPEAVLGAVRSEEQERLRPRIDALVAALLGYVDHVVDAVGHRLITSYGALTEALRRRRVEEKPSDRFVDHLLGLELTDAQFARGRTFVHGVLERGGDQALARLWSDEAHLPTPAEIDAPGLWLARIDL